MIFTDLSFFPFFAAVLTLIILNSSLLGSIRLQNLLLLTASYYFYAQWDERFLLLIVGSTLLDFTAGMMIRMSSAPRTWLILSLTGNLGLLGVFKYFNFFVSEAVTFLNSIGLDASEPALSIILPVGISFYTFQTLTYTIDIYRGRLEPTSNLLAYAAYVAFFPQLVAGPIERAERLLPQFSQVWRYEPDRIIQGLRFILFGLTLKIAVADNLAPLVNDIFHDPTQYDGGVLGLGAVYFAFQIYGDFCGYSAIAIGLAKLLNFELMTNFSTPYFATSIQDFWRRWHISLSTFFRDYVYIPLGGSRAANTTVYRNILITFGLSGLWHGANWTFIVWGLFHGIALCIQQILSNRLPLKSASRLHTIWQIPLTFSLVTLSWIVFRCESLGQAWTYMSRLFSEISMPDTHLTGLGFVAIAIILDLLWRNDNRMQDLSIKAIPAGLRTPARWLIYTLLFWLIIAYFSGNEGQAFIYFQF